MNDLKQIEKDIDRSYFNDTYFDEGKPGWIQLEEILKVLAFKYFGWIGYVQGMNFIVATLLCHASP